MIDTIEGLSSIRAEELLKVYGLNDLDVSEERSVLRILVSQFKSFLIFLLFIASLVSFLVKDMVDGTFIFVVILLDALLGFAQEFKAERALETLKRHNISRVRVLRDHKEQEIDSRYVVPGDILLLVDGNKIPADGKLLESVNLEVDESVLTGESLPVFKHPADPDNHMLFMGTIVARGRGKLLVTKTGMYTEFGKLAGELSTISATATPLEKNLNELGKQMTVVGIVGGFLVVLFTLLYHGKFLDGLFTSITLAVAVVPEGLPTIVIVALAGGTTLMAKRNAIIRRMSVIETLGATTLIATDKTGTLTKNEMVLKRLWMDNRLYIVDRELPRKSNETYLRFLEISALCNNAKLLPEDGKDLYEVVGDKTEGSLLEFLGHINLTVADLMVGKTFVDEFSFDEVTNTMSVVYKEGQQMYSYTKGAPERMIIQSSYISLFGKRIPMTKAIREDLQRTYEALASRGFRVLGFAYKKLPDRIKKHEREFVEHDMVFVGLAGIVDPARSEVRDALRISREAKIKTVMITGDNELTAREIGREVGLLHEGEQVMTGAVLNEMSDDELKTIVSNVRIFARCSPMHKLRIVKVFQSLGEVVAVTGDGVNDALAFKQADAGIAMGLTGTDVAREAADVVISDDNYATIVAAIEEGRIIFDNIIKSVGYLIAGNLSEVLVLLIAVMVGLPSPLLPVQILWMNLVTDSLPAIALALDKKHMRVMKRPPVSLAGSLFSRKRLLGLCSLSFLITALTLYAYWITLYFVSLTFARTVAFSLIIVLQMVLAFYFTGRRKWYTNTLLLFSVGIALLAQLFILTVPYLQHIFQVVLP